MKSSYLNTFQWPENNTWFNTGQQSLIRIDELEKSNCTVLKSMKLISYEADYNMIDVEMVVVDHGL